MCQHREHRFRMKYRIGGERGEWQTIAVNAKGLPEAFARLDGWLAKEHPFEAVELQSFRTAYADETFSRSKPCTEDYCYPSEPNPECPVCKGSGKVSQDPKQAALDTAKAHGAILPQLER